MKYWYEYMQYDNDFLPQVVFCCFCFLVVVTSNSSNNITVFFPRGISEYLRDGKFGPMLVQLNGPIT